MNEGILCIRTLHEMFSTLGEGNYIEKREILQKHSKVSGLDVEPERPGKREQNFLFSLRLGA